MYSGTTFRIKSGRVMGVHQRIDRVARRQLSSLLSDPSDFPKITSILHFEGLNGPDGIKRKSPGRDEPWHFIDPKDPGDSQLLDLIDNHINNLAEALKAHNDERAAFEAAWLAHAVTDGLTPAHHYPLEDKLMELRGGEGLDSRSSKKKKIILPGDTKFQQIANNWEYWGARGVMTTHIGFELGVAAAISSHRFPINAPNSDLLERVEKLGYRAVFIDILKDVDALGMYESFTKSGWSRRLAREARQTLLPYIMDAVCLAWHAAIRSNEK